MKFKTLLLVALMSLTSCASFNSSKNNPPTKITDTISYDKNYVTYVDKVENAQKDKILPFNTSMYLTTYSDDCKIILGDIFKNEIKRLHILFDRYNNYLTNDGKTINNLKVINDSYATNKELVIDEDLFNLLKLSIEMSKLTRGYFNPTMGNLIDAWNNLGNFSPFNEEKTALDDLNKDVINSKLESIVPYDKLEEVIVLNEENFSVTFKKYPNTNKKVVISLGALAKGYAIDYIRLKFEEYQTSYIASGSASSTFLNGKNPNPLRDEWRVMINSPYKDEIFENEPLMIIEDDDKVALSTSGDSEKSFYFYDENGNKVIRHHILNPFSGYSENYYRNITLISDSRCDILDALSTALFNIEDRNLLIEIVHDIENYYHLKIDLCLQEEVSDHNLNIYLNNSFKEKIVKYSNDSIKVNEVIFNEI